MKLVLLSGLLLIVSIASSQYADSSVTRLTTDYFGKSNKQKTAGWILFGGGAVLTCIGVIAGAGSVWKDLLEGDSRRTNRAGVVILTGLVGMAGSIPLFVAPGKNRAKAAASVSFNIDKATIINSWVKSVSRHPAWQ